MTEIPRRQEPVEQTMARLETFIRRMERRYECPSDEALAAVREGRMRETAEVGRWLSAYQDLLYMQEIVGTAASRKAG